MTGSGCATRCRNAQDCLSDCGDTKPATAEWADSRGPLASLPTNGRGVGVSILDDDVLVELEGAELSIGPSEPTEAEARQLYGEAAYSCAVSVGVPAVIP